MNLEFKRLTEVAPSEIIDLMNNQLVREQMPLFSGVFTEDTCKEFVAAKELLWSKHGYGPWAFMVDDQFVGWGGLQDENGDADLAMVLNPDYWGIGKHLYHEIIKRAFGEMRFNSLTVLLPTSRKRIQGLLRLGFKKESELKIEGKDFIKFRLLNPTPTT